MRPHRNAKAFKKNSKFTKHNKSASETGQCLLCEGTHRIWGCETFKAMNITGRKNHVSRNNLCVKCLQESHNGQCENARSNNECPKCRQKMDVSKFHNSLLCPNSDNHLQMALMASEGQNKNRKRKNQHNGPEKNPKRRRTDVNKHSEQDENMPSSVNKIGNWTLAATETNALSRINSSKQAFKGKIEYSVLLATIKMRMQVGNVQQFYCRGITDTGAFISGITKQCVEENALPSIKCQKAILGVSGPDILKRKIKASVSPWFESDTKLEVEFYIMEHFGGTYPNKHIEASKDDIKHLGLADEEFDVPAPIDVLLGVEVFTQMIKPDLYYHKHGAIMQATSFGHIVLGKVETKDNFTSDLPLLSIVQNENDSISKALSKFWEIEELNKNHDKALSEEEAFVEKHFTETFYRDASGKYVVTIPLKPECVSIGESRSLAMKQFLQLERRFEKKPDLHKKYIEAMQENISLGFMRKASESPDPNFCYYLPHHAVEKKFRIVMNASARTRTGESLNSVQFVGSKLQYDLQLQIMRFRRNRIGVATDISKMYNRIGLNQKHWDLHRILWRESPKHVLKEYVMK